jgi:hypothetical protein
MADRDMGIILKMFKCMFHRWHSVGNQVALGYMFS